MFHGTYLLFFLLGAGLLLAGFLLDGEISLNTDRMVIAGGAFAGYLVFLLGSKYLAKVKTYTIKKERGAFPQYRSYPFKVLAGLWLALASFIYWPISYLLLRTLQVLFFWLPEPYLNPLLILTYRDLGSFFYMYINPMWDVQVLGSRKHIRPRTIIMCNHLTYADAYVTSAAMWGVPCNYISTSWVFKLPFGGWGARIAGDQPVKFVRKEGGGWQADKATTKRTMANCQRFLAQHQRLFVFPEGDLSKSGELKEFKSGFFRLALDETKDDDPVYIVPAGLWGSQTLWRNKDKSAQPGYAEIKFGNPITVTPGMELDELKETVGNAIIELRDSLPLHQKTSPYLALRLQSMEAPVDEA